MQGVTCAACIGTIERAVAALPGAPSARLNYATRRLRVSWRDEAFDPAQVAATLAPLGYRARPFELGALEREDAEQMQFLLRCLAVAGFAAMNVMLLSVSIWAGEASGIDPATRDMFHWISALIALPAAIYAGRPFFLSAARALRGRKLNMDVPISVGVTLALGLSVAETARGAQHAYFDSALMLLFFLLLGRVLDAAMRRRTRGVAANLASLRATQATRIRADGGLQDMPASALQPGDRLLVRPGERLAADGRVASGQSVIDDSLVTGETRGRAVGPGAQVYAGAINLSGALEIEVVAAGAGTLLDEIERLLENATAAKSRYVKLADRVAGYYAPVVHVAALLAALGWLALGASWHEALVVAISVLIVTCPCAVALAVPAVQVVVAGRLFRQGVLLNRGDAIERLAEADCVVFDKTGTLTLPEPALEGEFSDELLAVAARLALSSHHPLARTLSRSAQAQAPFADVEETPAQGVRAMIGGVEARLGALDFCGLGATENGFDEGLSRVGFRWGERTAVFGLRQALRADAVETIAQLRRRGYAIEILSGDSAPAVAEVARALGVTQYAGDLKPAQKVARLRALAERGVKTLMVGDGINDAPALAAAHVSMSPASAADLAQNAADAVFLGDRLGAVAQALTAGRRARAAMRQNLWIAAAYNVLALPLAASGHLTPILAAAAMSGSSLLVTLNALRVRGPTPQAKGGAQPKAGFAALETA
ncbi:MAG: cadmium-translocating P-type ATPase [Pseudomonadota bacterium]|nr:cadmium-translocating P-type ATPase [Pseudomonadota bacterium]